MPSSRTAFALINQYNLNPWVAYEGPLNIFGIYASTDKKCFLQVWDNDSAPAPGTPHPFCIPMEKNVMQKFSFEPPGIYFGTGITFTFSADHNVYTPIASAHQHIAVYGMGFFNVTGKAGDGLVLSPT